MLDFDKLVKKADEEYGKIGDTLAGGSKAIVCVLRVLVDAINEETRVLIDNDCKVISVIDRLVDKLKEASE